MAVTGRGACLVQGGSDQAVLFQRMRPSLGSEDPRDLEKDSIASDARASAK